VAECLASLAAASPDSCQQMVATFTSLQYYTERLEDVEAGPTEVISVTEFTSAHIVFFLFVWFFFSQ
jgi:hypothetical protein